MSEEVDELTFLFGAQAGPDLDGLGQASICMALASLAALKVSYVEGMVRPVEEGDALRHNSFSSTMTTAMMTSSMLLYS
jgi:hypothetical protein